VNRIINLILITFIISSCGYDEEKLCEESIATIDNAKISGQIFECNAMPPLQDFINAEAEVSIIGDSIRFDLSTLDGNFDTVLIYRYTCVTTDDGPQAKLLFENGDKEGVIENENVFFVPFQNVCENDYFRNN